MTDSNHSKKETSRYIRLPRGNILIEDLSIGSLLIGCPPEALKDVFREEKDTIDKIPQYVVLRDKLFDSMNKCISEELEQIVFYNYYKLKRTTYVICTEEQKWRQEQIIRTANFGKPVTRDEIVSYYPKDYDPKAIPDLKAEFEMFARGIELEKMISFHVFNEDSGSVEFTGKNPETGKTGTIAIIREERNNYTVKDLTGNETITGINAPITAPRVPFTSFPHPKYLQLRNAISFISTSSGFDPLLPDVPPEHAYGSTVSFVIWDDIGTGSVVDPPVGFPNWMRKMGIYNYKIQELILTHTHFDHDAGTIERILEDPVNVYTTESIMNAFLEKSSAVTGISEEQIQSSFNFYPIKLHTPVKIGGFTYYFSHSIHPIETIRFTFQDHEGNTYYYSSDILYSRKHLREMVEEGIITRERMEDIMTIPENASIYIHEQGSPNIHTPAESIAELPDHVRDKTWIVHTDTIPLLEDGSPVPGVRLARPGMIIPLQTPKQARIDEFSATYHMLSQLDRIPLFHNMPMASITDLRDVLRLIIPKKYEPGSQLIQYGDRPDKLYILLDGGVDIVIREHVSGDDSPPRQKMIHRSDFGFLIGDAIASVNEDRRDADVYAGMEGLTVLEIDEESIRELEGRNILLADIIRKNREMRKVGVYYALEKIPIVKDLSYSQKQEFALLCMVHPIKNEEERWLIKQGEWNEFLYIIAEGQAEVIAQERDGSKIAKKRIATSESNIFGEISILTQSKTIASVYITSDLDKTSIYKMHKNDFNNFLRNNPNFNLNFRKNMDERIAETTQVRKNLIETLRSLSKEFLQNSEQE